ncbi:kinase-like domain-containing protein [Zychaea mexicana]|uniref:kinase-like domain-containing protein n=1 Tax=Zychaea mexicana TaxID=64656 RepID=UPI0022FE1A96|nr:kinase-like domain-containing protein [Zychaea mexicana]KAI9492947.1 kinase-like domain-containing protein [Zychaea mexicana]
MGKPRDTTRLNNSSRKGGTRKSYLDSGDTISNHGGGSSSSSSSKISNSGSTSHSSSSRKTVHVLHKASSKESRSSPCSSHSLGVKSSGRITKRSHSKRTIERQVSLETEETYWREYTGVIPDEQLELEDIFGRDPNIWGYLESMNTAVVQSQILTRSAVGPAKVIRAHCEDRFSYLIGSGPTCDVRDPGNVLSPNHCMIYNRCEIHTNDIQGAKPKSNLILLYDRSNKGTWVNNVKMEESEVVLEDNDIISFKESNESEPYLSLRIRLPTYFRHIKDTFNNGIKAYYAFNRRIGYGSFGEVFEAECLTSGRIVAVKEIPRNKYEGKPKTLQSLLREIAIYTSLQHHPGIVRMERVLEIDGTFYIAMELGQSGDLFDHINSIPNPLTEDEVRIIFDQIFHAVEYLHDQDIAHRDLKLENIILMDKKNLRAKVADFGLATFYRGKPLHTMCGTQSYAAPELVLETSCNYDKAVDIWSLGVMLFLTLAKTPPFYDASVHPPTPEEQRIMLQRIKSADYNFYGAAKWETISDLAKDLINNMLVVDANERYTIKQVLQHPWLREVEASILLD